MGKKFQLCGASIIVYKDNQVLLQQRKDNKCWGYHGGAVEMGERVEDAARRELLEETGLLAKDLTLYGVFSGPEQYNIYPDGNEAYIIDIVYLCNEFIGDLHEQESEVIGLNWFDFDKIPENLSPPIKSVLIKFCNEQLQNI
jgi:8-oxo-dGTP pyrophosphatase MutT (NUDIX family)